MGKFGFSFSLNRLLGITQAKQRFARKTGIPTTKSGMERKIGSSILKMFFKQLIVDSRNIILTIRMKNAALTSEHASQLFAQGSR